MATRAAEVLGAVCDNGDLATIMGENPELFGAYGDVFEFTRSYSLSFKAVPTREILSSEFPDIELPAVKGATAYHLEALKGEYVTTRIDQIMLKAASEDAKTTMTPDQRLNKLLTSLSNLGQYTTNARDVNLKDIDYAQEHFEKIRKLAEENGGTPGISFGFDTIDSAYTVGMSGGHYIVLIGYSGKGKSMFSGLVAVNAWGQGKKVMVISLEMTPEEYMTRIYTMMGHGKFSMNRLDRGDVDPDDFRTWAVANLKDSPDFIIVSNEGASTITPHTIQAKIDLHRPDIVILDYLQLMSDNAQTGDMTKRMLNLSRQLKLMATSNNIPVIAITAVTDEDNDKRDGPPLVSQIAWSKGIEYDANLIVAVHLHEGTSLVEVVGRKNRHGTLFAMFFNVDFDAGIWEETFELRE